MSFRCSLYYKKNEGFICKSDEGKKLVILDKRDYINKKNDNLLSESPFSGPLMKFQNQFNISLIKAHSEQTKI